MKPEIKPPGTKRLKLKYDEPLSILLSISTWALHHGAEFLGVAHVS
jgi:hypothetical protein